MSKDACLLLCIFVIATLFPAWVILCLIVRVERLERDRDYYKMQHLNALRGTKPTADYGINVDMVRVDARHD